MVEERRKERLKGLTRQLEVCDLLDMRNPQSGAEFAPQIYAHLFAQEERLRYPQDFLANQPEIDRKKRSYLVDYLIEVHYKFRLQPETLYFTVGLLDRYLIASPAVPKAHLQLLGIAALHVAAKYEEIYPPALDKLLKVTQSAITPHEVVSMELAILTALDFDLVWPSALRFLERFVRVL
jgi:cyclin B